MSPDDEALAFFARILRAEAPPPSPVPDGEAGTITLAMLDQLFDDLWHQRIRFSSLEEEIAMGLAVGGIFQYVAPADMAEALATEVLEP